MSKTIGANTYTNEQITKGLRVHMIDNKLSKYSLFSPMTWQGVLKRIKDDEELSQKVNSIVSEHNALWEKMGIEALENGDESFNVPLFKMYAGSKQPFQTYGDLEIGKRISDLEESVRNGN